jgi:hypothetical protein
MESSRGGPRSGIPQRSFHWASISRGKSPTDIENGIGYELREPGVSYNYDFGVKIGTLSPENTYSWDFYI